MSENTKHESEQTPESSINKSLNILTTNVDVADNNRDDDSSGDENNYEDFGYSQINNEDYDDGEENNCTIIDGEEQTGNDEEEELTFENFDVDFEKALAFVLQNDDQQNKETT